MSTLRRPAKNARMIRALYPAIQLSILANGKLEGGLQWLTYHFADDTLGGPESAGAMYWRRRF